MKKICKGKGKRRELDALKNGEKKSCFHNQKKSWTVKKMPKRKKKQLRNLKKNDQENKEKQIK